MSFVSGLFGGSKSQPAYAPPPVQTRPKTENVALREQSEGQRVAGAEIDEDNYVLGSATPKQRRSGRDILG